MGAVDFDYDKAIRQATQIESIANDIKSMRNGSFQTAIESIGSCWRGEASNVFARQCETMKGDMNDYTTVLKELASYIREVARLYQEAEAAAKAAMNK